MELEFCIVTDPAIEEIRISLDLFLVEFMLIWFIV